MDHTNYAGATPAGWDVEAAAKSAAQTAAGAGQAIWRGATNVAVFAKREPVTLLSLAMLTLATGGLGLAVALSVRYASGRRQSPTATVTPMRPGDYVAERHPGGRFDDAPV